MTTLPYKVINLCRLNYTAGNGHWIEGYEVVQVTNSIDFSPGDLLSPTRVKKELLKYPEEWIVIVGAKIRR